MIRYYKQASAIRRQHQEEIALAHIRYALELRDDAGTPPGVVKELRWASSRNFAGRLRFLVVLGELLERAEQGRPLHQWRRALSAAAYRIEEAGATGPLHATVGALLAVRRAHDGGRLQGVRVRVRVRV